MDAFDRMRDTVAKRFWLSMYRDRFGVDAPPVTMRVMTADRPRGVTLPDDVPNYASSSMRFVLPLMMSWVAMAFRKPKFPYLR
ncbi:hypothetical protein E4L95_17755 [Paracoccus liaowanqingii]|uniref:Uncharacterized protein n=1 Tax=Paracoccus liaowanqingii TaxID=2560053 RepID=A0A4Z1CE50_9RHOB|nr:hypothetical protein [Paracoccus liaowanqingii]TGN50063.1 hypothetical protein E4L95_17755 [Paracoccus liaowanqingii]